MSNINSNYFIFFYPVGLGRVFALIVLTFLSCHHKGKEKISDLGDGRQIVKIYDENNQLRIEFIRKGNYLDGYYKTFFENGVVEKRNNYLNDTLNGEQRLYYENGNLKSLSFCREGKLDSIQKWYYSNGTIKSELFWLKGRRFGIQKQFDSTQKGYKIYFLNSCDSCMTLDLTIDALGKVTQKRGNLISFIYDKDTVTINDTINILFYAVTLDAYRYKAKLIDKNTSGKRTEKQIVLSSYNNNTGYLLSKTYKEKGEYLLGLSIALMDKTNKDYLEDSIFIPVSVTKQGKNSKIYPE